MSTQRSVLPCLCLAVLFSVTILFLDGFDQEAQAKQEYRDAFFTVYAGAVGTTIETVPSRTNHCGVCHWRFNGGGERNPYGARLQEVLGVHDTFEEDILSIQSEDPDSDGYSSRSEIEDLTPYTNTPTFPGLTPANVGNVSRVDVAEIQDHLVPGSDTIPPDVTVIKPNGGETSPISAVLTNTIPSQTGWKSRLIIIGNTSGKVNIRIAS